MSNNKLEFSEREMKKKYVCVCGFEGKGYEVAQHFEKAHNDLYKEIERVDKEFWTKRGGELIG